MITTKQKSFLKKFATSEYVTAFLISLIIWLLLFTVSGVLFSGFHFVDDHEIVRINSDLQTMSLPEVLYKWIMVDYNVSRFRPAYYIHRVFQTGLFGLHWSLWFTYACLQASITTLCLFVFGRLLQFSRLEAALLAGLTVFGYQAITWCRLGPAETTAMPFLAFALVCAAAPLNRRHYSLSLDFLLIFSTVFASLCKESFIIFIPVICLVRFWTVCKTTPNLSVGQKIRHLEVLPCYLLLLIGGLEILYIKFTIGTGGPGYAGVDAATFDFNRIFEVFLVLAQRGNLWFSLLFLSLLGLLVSLKKVLNRSTRVCTGYSLLVGFIVFLTVIPQVLLYTKSGLDQYYLFPVIIAFSLLNIQALALYRKNGLRWLTRLLIVILSFIFFKNIHLTWISFHNFAMDGRATAALLRTVESCTQLNSPILVVTNPRAHYELTHSLNFYLNLVSHRGNLLALTYGMEGTDFKSEDFPELEALFSFLDTSYVKKLYQEQLLDSLLSNQDGIEAVVVFPKLKDDFLATSKSWFQVDQYDRSDYKIDTLGGLLSLYCKK